MRIAIIGTGQVGSAIARGLKGKGYSVVLGARSPDDPDTVSLAAEVEAGIGMPNEVAGQADIIILALPWAAAEVAIRALGPLPGKIVIDCMNPLGMVNGKLSLVLGHSISGGELVQSWLPDAIVIKTLNQVGAEMMANNRALSQRPVMFMAGQDGDAKDQVAELLRALGFEALDAGDLSKARLLEPFGMVWINQALLRGKGRDWAFAAVSGSA